VAFWEALYYE